MTLFYATLVLLSCQRIAYRFFGSRPGRGWLFLPSFVTLSWCVFIVYSVLPSYWFLSHCLLILQLVIASVHSRNIFGVRAEWKRWAFFRFFTLAHIALGAPVVLFSGRGDILYCVLIFFNSSCAVFDAFLVDTSPAALRSLEEMFVRRSLSSPGGRLRPVEKEKASELLGESWLELMSNLRLPLLVFCCLYVAIICLRTRLFLIVLPLFFAGCTKTDVSPTSIEAIGIAAFCFFLLNWWNFSADFDFVSLQSGLWLLVTWSGVLYQAYKHAEPHVPIKKESVDVLMRAINENQ
jgi:hypothetical protein